ncbi:MAGUK p55 subfamily member 4-like [Micropterus dolomieu]|uniref:MAGUK p55 subfamily member 4-like n=1 Tax=Micropterus dolomieu TaxID=147949 RepID=UPI001E8E4D6F|nr:MAGUK p55 subfamily member 4-like [Micropterus dolomieu]
MRQAVEAEVLNPHCELGEHGLRQILTDVIEEVRQSVNHDIDGAEILHSLLNASWLQSLLKVYECLQRYLRDSPAPALDYSSGLTLQLLIDIRSLPGYSEEAKELYRLLRQPHLQLHQRVGLPSVSSPRAKSSKGGIRSHWDTLRRLTRQKLHRDGSFRVQSPAAGSLDVKYLSWCSIRRGSYPPTEPPCHAEAAQHYHPSHYKPVNTCQICCSTPVSQCRICYTNLLWEKSLNHSAPSVYSSVLIDNVIEELDSGDENEAGESTNAPSLLPTARRWTMSPPCLTVPCYSNVDDYLQPGLHPRLRGQSPRIRTAPPSPMRPHHVDLPTVPPLELAKQESLDELRTTVQLAATSMENSTKDIKLLGEKMAAASERMSDTVQDNSQALVLLSQVVDRLQTLLAATRTDINTPKPAVAEQDGTPKKSQTPKSLRQCPSLTHQFRYSFPTLPSFTSSSSSLSSSLDAPSTSQGTSCLSVSCHGSPRTTLKTKNASVLQKKHLHAEHLQTNGLLEEPKTSHTGATIKRNEITGEIFVARVIHGGLADRSGLLHAGDRIIEVNGFPVDGLEPEQVIQVVQAKSHGTVMFKVVPITERPVHNQTMLYVRAMGDYSPQQDPTIPCADAGMSFRKGEVLEIVDQTDTLWWQAKKLPSHTACAGLIPSTNLLKRKERDFWWSQSYQPHAGIQTLSTVEEEEDLIAIDEKCVEADEETFESEELREEEDDFSSKTEGIYLVGFRRSMRLCRRRSHSTIQPSCHTCCPSSCFNALNSPYEEVVRYQRHPQDVYRLIALLGPSGVGVNELRRRLIEINPNIFQGAIPHTTRAPRGYEESGREYYFTRREIFDNMVYNNRFLEYGEHNGNLYGTSIESVKDVLNSRKICVIDIEPNVSTTSN